MNKHKNIQRDVMAYRQDSYENCESVFSAQTLLYVNRIKFEFCWAFEFRLPFQNPRERERERERERNYNTDRNTWDYLMPFTDKELKFVNLSNYS